MNTDIPTAIASSFFGIILILGPFSFFRVYPWINRLDKVQPHWLPQAYFTYYLWRFFHPIILACTIWISMTFWGIVELTDLSAPARLLLSLIPDYFAGTNKFTLSVLLMCISYFGLESLGKSIVSSRGDDSTNNWKKFRAYRWRRTKHVAFETLAGVIFSSTSLLSISIIFS